MMRNLFYIISELSSKTVLLRVGSFFLLGIIPSLILQLNSALAEDNTTTIENNINRARQVIEAFNTGNVSNVSEFISSSYFNHESQVDPVRGELRGPEEFIDTIKNLRTAFPDLHHEEQTIISQGNIVISVINLTGTHTGNFFILPPTGKKISYEAVHIYKIGEDGKIIEHKAIRDDLTFLAQLGVIEASSPEYKPFFQALTSTTNSSR
jgi:steroid delta-isomerase-like uncharacterized protein